MKWSSTNQLGIVVAVYDEVKDILENPFYEWQHTESNIYYSSKYSIKLVISGIGKANASYALGRISSQIKEVWIVGTSGGLGNEDVGSMYLSTEFVEHDMDATGLGFPKGVTPFSDMEHFLITNPSQPTVDAIKFISKKLGILIKEGRTMSGDQFIHDPLVVEQCCNDFGVHLVDMESAAIAKICKREGIPVLALRTVSDNANHDAGNNWIEYVKQSSKTMNIILYTMLTSY